MKKNVCLYFAVLSVGLLVSCSKNNNSTITNAPPVQSSMSAKIDGVSWVATNFSGTNVSGTLVIEGAKSDGSQFSLSIPTNTAMGSHQAGNTNPCQAIYQTGTQYCKLYPGTIAISSNSGNVISGTFSGTFTNTSTNATISVTNGVFTSTYQ